MVLSPPYLFPIEHDQTPADTLASETGDWRRQSRVAVSRPSVLGRYTDSSKLVGIKKSCRPTLASPSSPASAAS